MAGKGLNLSDDCVAGCAHLSLQEEEGKLKMRQICPEATIK